ncbi:MAG TPA: threonine/serine dehydratase, partial [Thermoanaerobaculia bacterium]|nr:threonine/serine dehydratase [Thermoanaerobaculia bacterium]
EAAARIAARVHRTPLLSCAQLGDRVDARLFLKCESFQKTGSFKARGALNKVLSLSDAERARGLVTVSAGNHAAAVAWAARTAGASAVVVMPDDAPRSKVDAVRGYGAEIVFHADRPTLFDRLHQVRDERGLTFVHPFDDPVVLAGAGTTGLEIAEDFPDVDLVVVPVGGGGLLSGVASAIRAVRPRARVVAVELEAGPGLGPALAAGKPVSAPRPPTIADGMTPPFVGALAVEVARDAVDVIVTVTEDEILDGMRLLATRAKLYTEGSGAAATGALVAGKVPGARGANAVALVSGGNVDLEKFAAIVRPA